MYPSGLCWLLLSFCVLSMICQIGYLPKSNSKVMMCYFMLQFIQNMIANWQQLQKDLDSLREWAEKWKMMFNHSNCEFLRRHLILNQYTIQSKEIMFNVCIFWAVPLGITSKFAAYKVNQTQIQIQIQIKEVAHRCNN